MRAHQVGVAKPVAQSSTPSHKGTTHERKHLLKLERVPHRDAGSGAASPPPVAASSPHPMSASCTGVHCFNAEERQRARCNVVVEHSPVSPGPQPSQSPASQWHASTAHAASHHPSPTSRAAHPGTHVPAASNDDEFCVELSALGIRMGVDTMVPSCPHVRLSVPARVCWDGSCEGLDAARRALGGTEYLAGG